MHIVKRLPFLDWTRGLAVVLMIVCHTFNSFVRPDAQSFGGYMLSQFVGGMAAPLFLFMAGMTLAFQMESWDRKLLSARGRWLFALRRGAYVLGLAYLFRLSNYVGSLPDGPWQEITKVDILNAMGLAMMAFSPAALLASDKRAQLAAAGGLMIAAASPLVANLDWSQTPTLVRDYLIPMPAGGRFGFFPYGSYIGFGVAAGTVIKRSTEESLHRLMQWVTLIGLTLVSGAQYFSTLPFSVYSNSSFWTDSPGLIVIRLGVSLLMLAVAYVWTEYCAGAGWSWMQTLGRNSLMVYWTHLMIVYGAGTKQFHGSLNISRATLATLVVLGLMTGLSVAWRELKMKIAAAREGCGD